MRQSTPRDDSGKPSPRPIRKPKKPYPDFPLFAHATKRWAKKIRGKLHYFGPWDDPDGALKKYLEQRDYLHAGQLPPSADGRLTVRELVNSFLTGKQRRVDSQELSPRSWREYHDICELVISVFGRERPVETLAPGDFENLRGVMAQRWGPTRLGNGVCNVRMLFRYAYDADLVARPPRFGPNFRKPSKKVMALHRAARGERMFEAAELQLILKEVGPVMRAMVLLGLNCGLGNHDVGLLRTSNLDLAGGWLSLVRSKTGIMRRCPLWPETVQAIQDALAARPKPSAAGNESLVFLTAQGLTWSNPVGTDNPISRTFKDVLDKLQLYRPGLSFYTLRHVHRTIADEARDQPAANAIMGHADPTMASVYRERIGDERLKAVTDHVRAWLFPQEKERTQN